MAGAIDAAVRQGKLTPDEVRKLKESGVDIETMVGKKVREQMYEKIVVKELDSGSPVFNREEVLEKLPADLGLEREEAERKVKEIASERLRGALVQAASNLRQKKRDLVVSERRAEAVPAAGCIWEGEVQDWSTHCSPLFCIFLHCSVCGRKEEPRVCFVTKQRASRSHSLCCT